MSVAHFELFVAACIGACHHVFFLMLLGGIKVRFFFLEIMAYVLSGHIPKKQNKTKNSENFALLSVTKLQNIKWHCPLGAGEQL